MARVALDAQGSWYRGRGEGRGAWLCAEYCVTQVQAAQLSRALRRSLGPEDAAKVRGLWGQ